MALAEVGGHSTGEDRELLAAVSSAVRAADLGKLRETYREQNEFVALPGFLPRELVERRLSTAAEGLKQHVNRNFIPGHKKGGSVSYALLQEHAPIFQALYQSPEFIEFLSNLVGARLLTCPPDDLHSCALYYYTEPGDHIGYHYDTSYYKGARYTILLGLVERSPSCRLVCQLYKDDPQRETQELSLPMDPGTMVIFNGDKLWHAVTPLAAGEERIVLTLEYVTNQEMGRFHRIFSNLKDAFAYFGPASLFKGRPKK